MKKLEAADAPRAARLPAGVWALGLVSLFMDLSSESIHGLLPVFLVTTLGATPLLVGVIDGLAEAVASLTKLLSGSYSDRWRRRKPLLLAGYGLAAFSKLLFPLALSAYPVLFARALDRFGKGLRGAPRDALIADLTAPAARGAAYGLRQALDTVGAVLGPLLALLLMQALHGNMRAVFAWAIVPAAISVAVVVLFVREPRSALLETAPPTRRRGHWREFDADCRAVFIVAALFGLARCSEAFLVLRATQQGLPIAAAPLTLVLMNLVYAAAAYPLGRLSDRLPRTQLLLAALIALCLAQLSLAAPWRLGTALGIVLWGLHLAASQGVVSALLADLSPPALRASAFGYFNLLNGIAGLAASVLAGALWTWVGAGCCFLVGAASAASALLFLLRVAPQLSRRPSVC